MAVSEDSLVGRQRGGPSGRRRRRPRCGRRRWTDLRRRHRRESRRGGAWHEAWIALAAWLEGLASSLAPPTPDQARHVHRLLGEFDGTHMSASTDCRPRSSFKDRLQHPAGGA